MTALATRMSAKSIGAQSCHRLRGRTATDCVYTTRRYPFVHGLRSSANGNVPLYPRGFDTCQIPSYIGVNW